MNIDGVTTTSAEVVAGASVQLDAPTTSSYFRFTGWSDKGAAAHALTMPARDVTLTARYVTAIEAKYASSGGARSLLGKAKGPEYSPRAGAAAPSSTAGSSGARPPARTRCAARSRPKFVKAGGIKAFGFPTTDEVAVKGGRASYFSKARIYYAPGLGAHFSRGKLLAKYLAAGGPDGYGLPQTDDKKIRGGYYAGFTAGRSIYFSKSTKAHLVYGNVRKKYKAMGYERAASASRPATSSASRAEGGIPSSTARSRCTRPARSRRF